MGIVSEQFPEERDRMVGLFASIFPIGGIIGPNLGGLLVEHASWRMVFLVNVPIGVLILAALLGRATESTGTGERRIDLGGAAMLAAGIAALLAALTLLGNDPAFGSTPAFWSLLGGSVVLLLAFVWQETRTPEPVVDLHLVARHPFLAINTYNFLFGACVFGFSAFIPYYAQVQFGMSPSQSGAVLAPRSLAMVATSTVASLYLIRWGYRLPMLLGLGCWVVTLFILSQGWSSWTISTLQVGAFWLVALEVALSGIGSGLAAPSSNNASLDLLPQRAALITGIRGMFRSVGGVVGTALIVLVLQFSPDRATGLRLVFGAMAVILVAVMPLTFAIPDSARRRRRELAQRAERIRGSLGAD